MMEQFKSQLEAQKKAKGLELQKKRKALKLTPYKVNKISGIKPNQLKAIEAGKGGFTYDSLLILENVLK